MRLLLLTVDFPPAVGGIQNLLARLAEGLAASHDVSVVAPRHSGASTEDADTPYEVTRAPAFTFWPFVMFAFLCTGLWTAMRRPPQVVICGHVLLGPASWVVARLFGARLVVMAYALEIRAPRMRRLAGWTLRHAAAIVTISDFSRRAIMAHDVAPERIVVIHPGAASVPRTPDRRPPTPRPPALGTPDRRPPTPRPPTRFILTVARLAELYKGHDMVLRAMPLILAREPNAQYAIVGDGPLKPYLERLSKSLGIEGAVQFLGELPDDTLDSWYSRANVFTLMSRDSPVDGGAEGYGLSVIEAGARGKPVVAGRSGGIPDAVVDGVTGLLVDPTDIAAIADALLRVLGDSELAARLGEQGRRRAVEELAWSNFVGAFQTVIDPDEAPASVRPVGAPGA